jgi:Sulfotransferase family
MPGEGASLRPIIVRLLDGRVGSTFMMQMLATSPEIALDRVHPYENSYLTYFVRVVDQMVQPRPPEWRLSVLLYGDPERIGPLPFDLQELHRPDLARESLAGLWSGFSRAMREASPSPVRWYAEKYWGPLDPLVVARLEPVVIDLVRDPRDMVASIRAFNATREGRLFGRAQAPDDKTHLRRLVAGMALRFAEMERTQGVASVTLRYEDVVADPEAASRQVETLIDVTLRPSELPAGRSDHVTSESPAASVGRWRADLTDGEVGVIERKLGRHMVALGYELSDDRRSGSTAPT